MNDEDSFNQSKLFGETSKNESALKFSQFSSK